MKKSMCAIVGAVFMMGTAACGSKKDEGKKAGGDEPAKPATVDKTDKGATGAVAAVDAPKLADPKTLFSAGKPAPAGLLGKIELGATKSGDAGAYLFAYPFKEVAPGVTLYASRETGKKGPDDPIVALSVEMTGEAGKNARAWATEAWGEPTVSPDNSGTKINGQVAEAYYWWNPEKHVYARLVEGAPGKLTLRYLSYMPLAEVLGEGKEHFGFEAGLPLLGAKTEQLEAAYGPAFKSFGKNGKIELPPYELQHERGKTAIHWKAPEGTIVEYRFSLAYKAGTAEDPRQHILDALAKKLGEPKEEDVAGQKHLVYSEKPKISVFEQTGTQSFDVTVSHVE